MSVFDDHDLVEQWKQHKISDKRTKRAKRVEEDVTRNIFNREFKSRLLANSAKESLLARKILIEMYVDRLNKHDND